MFETVRLQFFDHLRVIKNSSEHTLRNYGIDLRLFQNFLSLESIKFESVDRKTIRAFLAWLHQEGQSKKTVARRLSTLRSFFKYLQAKELITINPTDAIETPKLTHKLPVALSYEQISYLLSQPDVSLYLGFRDRTMMELFYSSGLRVSELVALNREDFDHGNLILKLKGKGKKERLVPMTSIAANYIKNYLEHHERHSPSEVHQPETDHKAIFLNKLGSRLTARSVDRLFDGYLKKSGIAGKVTPHTIRHTIATHWLENGMDLKTIQLLLGHESLSTTTIYTQISQKLKKSVYDKTHPRA